RLGLPLSEQDFDAAMQRLDGVRVDPPPVVGRDYHPQFPPDRPFDPAAWQTGPPAPSVAVPTARPGGVLRVATESWPPTIRTEGPNSRLALLSTMHGLIYETLLGYDLYDDRYVPALASHWQIEPDRRTFRFRLDPEARWADGRPVTSDDVVATFEHLRNPDRRDPLINKLYGELIERVTPLDRLTVEIVAREPRWRSFLTISGTQIYPAAYIRMDGETYLREWNWRLPPGSGPYEIRPEDIRKGRSITLRRRKDWWQQGRKAVRGMYNFDAIRFELVRNRELMYQKFLAGELDLYFVSVAQRWVDEVDRERAVRKGWVQKRRVHTESPNGYGGYCFNMRVPPFSSRNVRLAFAHLFNREKLFAKYFFYQYEYMDSYFPGQKWARPNRERVHYDPERARALLAADGWTHRDEQGFLVNDKGERFPTITMELGSSNPASLRIHRLTKDELWNEAGIRLELKITDFPSLLKKVWDGQFKVVYWFWSAGFFPDPEYQFHSKFADQKQSNNLNGLKIPELDRILDAYRYEFDPKKRLHMLQRVDELVFNAHPYALAWYAPYFRVLYWDRFGHPPEYADRFGDGLDSIMAYWWFDPDRDRALRRAMQRGVSLYPDRPLGQYDPVEQRWWASHHRPAPRTEEDSP
ncbi:MAG: hypothetical protein D6776_05450, partial [Planctomycetota bacterium]